MQRKKGFRGRGISFKGEWHGENEGEDENDIDRDRCSFSGQDRLELSDGKFKFRRNHPTIGW